MKTIYLQIFAWNPKFYSYYLIKRSLEERIQQLDDSEPIELDLINSSVLLPEIAIGKLYAYWGSLPSNVRQRIQVGALIVAGGAGAVGVLLLLQRPILTRGGLDPSIFLKPATKIATKMAIPQVLEMVTPILCEKLSHYASREKVLLTGIQALTSVNDQILLDTLMYLNKTISNNAEVNYLNKNILLHILILCRNSTNLS